MVGGIGTSLSMNGFTHFSNFWLFPGDCQDVPLNFSFSISFFRLLLLTHKIQYYVFK